MAFHSSPNSLNEVLLIDLIDLHFVMKVHISCIPRTCQMKSPFVFEVKMVSLRDLIEERNHWSVGTSRGPLLYLSVL